MGGAICLLLLLIGGCASSRGAAPAPASPASSYRIGPGDTLDILVWKEDTVSGPVIVRADGKVSVPLIGDVAAAGSTPEELADAIRTGLERFIDNPNVVVRLAATARRFYVVGNVRSPGMYELRADQTLVQALAVAGGFTEFANRGRIRIIRQGGTQTTAEHNYDTIVRGDAPDVRLEPNDTIIVP